MMKINQRIKLSIEWFIPVVVILVLMLYSTESSRVHHQHHHHHLKGTLLNVKSSKLSEAEHKLARDALIKSSSSLSSSSLNNFFLEGDILIRKKPNNTSATKRKLVDKLRNAVHSDQYIWPNGVIPYVIDSTLESQKALIQKAMSQIMRYTCIRFREKTDSDVFYVKIFKGIGCYASIGRDPDFAEGLVSLGEGCYYVGTVVHELMHVIGYYHEHNRHDRDDYLTIHWDNIKQGEEEQFEINDATNERILTAFDYNSVMLYGPRAFSKDDKAITMEPKLSGYYMIEVYEKPGLTQLDATSIKKLYKC